MKRKIKSYEDLEKEEQLLEELLHAQKQLVQLGVEVLKQQLKPATMALKVFNKITTVDRSNILLNEGANKVIDLVFSKFILARSGWITRFLVPMLRALHGTIALLRPRLSASQTNAICAMRAGLR